MVDQIEKDNFALALASGMDLRGAYTSVFGEETVYPRARALELFSDADVQDRVKRIRAHYATLEHDTKAEHLDSLARIRDRSEALGQYKTAFQCERSRGEVLGFYKDAVPLDRIGSGGVQVVVMVGGKEQPITQKIDVIDMEPARLPP